MDDLTARTDQMVDDLDHLVSVESPSEDPDAIRRIAAAAATLAERRIGHAPEIVEVEGRPHLRWQVGAPRVLLLGHLDTVWPLGTLERWPFRIDGDVATGPGVFDMKAGLVIALHAIAAIGVPEGVAILMTTDEELGSPTSRALVEDTARDLEATLVLEPAAGDGVKLARKGTSDYRLHVTGRAAHAGLEPERGANALVAVARLVLGAADLARPDQGTTVTPTMARAGTTMNTVPAEAWLHLDARAESAAEQERVDAGVRGLDPGVEGVSVRVDGGINRPPLPSASSDALFARARRVAADLGLPPLAGARVGGGSDGNFTAALGVPTLDGLGAVGGGAHAEGEHVRVSALPQRAALVAGLLRELTHR